MDSNPNAHDQSPKSLSSAQYRARLLTKLNCLIAVLDVAIAKISRSMDLPGANEERLLRIRSNLKNTLSICHRAKHTLESSDHEDSASAPALPAPRRRQMTYRDYVELSSIDEYKKFKQLPPIRTEDLVEADIDDLIGRLQED